MKLEFHVSDNGEASAGIWPLDLDVTIDTETGAITYDYPLSDAELEADVQEFISKQLEKSRKEMQEALKQTLADIFDAKAFTKVEYNDMIDAQAKQEDELAEAQATLANAATSQQEEQKSNETD